MVNLTPVTRDWLSRIGPARPDAPVLHCFPHAGAGASTFWRWRDHLSARAELAAVQLPGREERMHEPRLTSLEGLMPPLRAGFGPGPGRPFAFFGHSLGALIAFELARGLCADGWPAPRFLAVSGLPAPQVLRVESLHTLPDDELMEALLALGHIPAAIAADPQLLALVRRQLPLLRDDLAIAASYRHVPGPPLPFPILAFGGDKDTLAPIEQVAAWREQTAGGFSHTVLPGHHFYLFDPATPVLPLLTAAFGES